MIEIIVSHLVIQFRVDVCDLAVGSSVSTSGGGVTYRNLTAPSNNIHQ